MLDSTFVNIDNIDDLKTWFSQDILHVMHFKQNIPPAKNVLNIHDLTNNKLLYLFF